MKKSDRLRMNEQIRAASVRLIDEKGQQKGIVDFTQALNLARQNNMDLVEIVPNQTPPVCKIMDYNKHRYEQEKKLKQQRKQHRTSQIKEIHLRPKIGRHDLDIKIRQAREFLGEGKKVRFLLSFKGRETVHKEFGHEVLKIIQEELSGIGTAEGPVKAERFQMLLLMAPVKHQKA